MKLFNPDFNLVDFNPGFNPDFDRDFNRDFNRDGVTASDMGGAAGIKDVARAAGVSVGTVSNVINRPELVGEETRARVRAAIDLLGYVRSESARQLRSGSSRIIGLLVLDLGNPFFVSVARGAESAARAEGLRVMVCNSAQRLADEADYLALFAEQRVRGVLLTPADTAGSGAAALRRGGVPFVLVDRLAQGVEACSVSVDDVRGGSLAVAHLLTGGHRRIAFAGGHHPLQQVADRRSGARAALAGSGAELADLEVDGLDVAAGRDAGARLLGMQPRPTAVFCANDLLALGMLQAAFAAGLRVPEDLAIVGYDDIEFAAAAAVPLTSVRQPAEAMGRTAVEMLAQETGPNAAAHRHRQVVFEPELVVRRSTLRVSATPAQ